MICTQPQRKHINEKIYQLHNDCLARERLPFRPPRPHEEMMQEKEKAAWQAFKDKKA